MDNTTRNTSDCVTTTNTSSGGDKHLLHHKTNRLAKTTMTSKLTSSWFAAAVILAMQLATQAVAQTLSDSKTRTVSPGGKFIFKCPPIDDPDDVTSFQVSWMHDNAVWLKINDGHLLITNLLTTFYPRQIAPNRNHVTVQLNKYRYKFTYDELNGVFIMTINDAQDSDAGIWKCTVETKRGDDDRSYMMYTDYRKLRVGTNYERSKSYSSESRLGAGRRPTSSITGGGLIVRPSGSRDRGAQSNRKGSASFVSANGNSGGSATRAAHQPATFTHVDGQRAGDAIIFQRVGTSASGSQGQSSSTKNRRRSRFNDSARIENSMWMMLTASFGLTILYRRWSPTI